MSQAKVIYFMATSRMDFICHLEKAGFSRHFIGSYLLPIVKGGLVIKWPLQFTMSVIDNLHCRVNMADEISCYDFDWYSQNIMATWVPSRLAEIDNFLLDS